MHKGSLCLAFLFLLLYVAYAAPATPATPVVSAETNALVDEERKTDREIAFVRKFKNFYKGPLKDKSPKQVAAALIKERQAETMDEQMDYWFESLLVRKAHAEETDAIREAVQEARRISRVKPSTSTLEIPKRMLPALLISLPPVTSLPKGVIEATWRKAKEEVDRENEELRDALSLHEDVKAMNEVLEILLSQGLARDSKWYEHAMDVAQRSIEKNEATQCLRVPNYLDSRMADQLARPFNMRFEIQDRLAKVAERIEQKKSQFSELDIKIYDNDKQISKYLVAYFCHPKSRELLEADIQKAMLDAREVVTLQIAMRNHKIRALRKLLQDNADYDKYVYQSLVEEAARKDDLDALKVLLEFSKFPKDYATALHVAVERRVKSRKGRMKIPEKNTEMISFLLEDKHTTLRTMDKIRKSAIPFTDQETLNEWKEWKEQKNMKELREMKELKLLKKHAELKKLKSLKNRVDAGEGIREQYEKFLASASIRMS